jgi:fimbrial chaperone protein
MEENKVRMELPSIPMLKRIIYVLFIWSVAASSYGNISLSKYRLYFDNNNRSDALQLRNTGSNAINYRVELGLVAMTEEGILRAVDEDPMSAKDFLKYSPKSGTIAPGEAQALRFAVRKPASLAEGEYRAVLNITTTNQVSAVGTVSIQPKLSYSVPIIVRHGRLEASTQLLEPRLVMKGDTPHIELWQSLEGNRSLFGDFTMIDEDGNEIGLLKSSAVYLPLNGRKILIPLKEMVKGKVTVQYKENAKYGGNLEATTEIELH